MFDIGWQELFILVILAVIVVGPKDLPRAVKTITHWLRKARGLAREFQSGVDEMVREADLDDIRNEANKIGHMDLEETLKDTIDPTGEVIDATDLTEVKDEMNAAVNAEDEKSDSVADADSDVDMFDMPDGEPDTSDSVEAVESAAAESDSGSETDETPAPKTNG